MLEAPNSINFNRRFSFGKIEGLKGLSKKSGIYYFSNTNKKYHFMTLKSFILKVRYGKYTL
mgnify:CR=1 FL=1